MRTAYRLPYRWRRTVLLLWDMLAWALAVGVLLIFRYDLELTHAQWDAAMLYLGCAVVLQLVVGLAGTYLLGRHRTGTFDEMANTSILMFVFAIPLSVVLTLLVSDLPRGISVLAPAFALIFMLGGRGIFRTLKYSRRRALQHHGAKPVLVYGAGEAGQQLADLIDMAGSPPYRIIGFIDDAPENRHRRVRRYRVLGTGPDLGPLIEKHGAGAVIVAIRDADAQLLQDVSATSDTFGIETIVIPTIREMIGGRVSLAGLRKLTVEDLLGRRPIETDLGGIAGYLTGKVVLVTGAGGSIGSEIARQVHRLGPARLVLLDRDESALHGVELDLYGHGLLDSEDFVLCSIRDYEALKAVFEHHRPEVVFHAAALKHLPMLERFPLEGWKTNVLGTLNVLRCARETDVARLVNISTDKAADACSVLGQTKRVAERLTSHFALTDDLGYLSVRFGNVLGSRGSVLHTFRAQIDRGGPVTVTHPDVTRYFMTIPEACELVLQAGAIGKPGDVLVLDMGKPVKIYDVARRMASESPEPVEITFTGLRAGEKMHEVLFSAAERSYPSAHPLIHQVHVAPIDPAKLPLRPSSKEEILHLTGNNDRGNGAGGNGWGASSAIGRRNVS